MPHTAIDKNKGATKKSATRKGAKVMLTLGAGALMAAGVATSPAFATPPSGHDEPQKVTICHATGSETNPFVQITVADESIFEAHSEHQNMRDIVPAFTFVNSKGESVSFAGLNLTASGQAMLDNGCAVAVATPAAQTPTPMASQPGQTVAPMATTPAGAAAAQPGAGAGAAAAPGEVTIAAQTGVGAPAADDTVSTALLGSGLLTLGWVVVSTV